MAESFLSAVVEQTLHRVLFLITDEMIMLSSKSTLLYHLRGIQSSIVAVIDMLQDADMQRTRKEPVRLWLIKLKELAYETEDVLDELSYQILRLKVHKSIGGILFHNKLVFSRLALEVKNINQLLEISKNKGMDYGLQWISNHRIMPHPRTDQEYIRNSDYVDLFLESEIRDIFLTNTNNPHNFTTVLIVGMSSTGGNTTLAEFVCGKAMETNFFDIKIWVSLSHRSDEHKICLEMLQSLNGTMRGTTNKDVILEQLEKELFRKRFLLVLDDVLDDISWWWDGLKTCLWKISSKTQNAIIVTSCSEQAASVVQNASHHTKIRTPYRGRRQFDEEAQLITRDTNAMTGIPSVLKSCLQFCLSFPKEFPFQKEELIQFWIAEGLVQSHDKGNICFDALVRNSLLQDVERGDVGDVVTCKVHGHVHNFVSLLSRSENLFEHDHSGNYTPSYFGCFYETAATAFQEGGCARTLILGDCPFQKSWKLDSLRTIVFLNSVDLEELPSSIGRLKHLRHIDVSNTRIRALPEFVTKFYNLHTLKFLNCKELNELPRKKFNNLVNMKKIAFSFEHQMPFGLGKLTCLETLSFFVVGSDRGGSIRELKSLNRLRGNLEITRLEEVRDKKAAKIADLRQKENINGLSFQWSYGSNGRSSVDEELLEDLQPHPNLEKLKIKYYMGKKWPSWMLRTWSRSDGNSFVMNNLVDLKLEQCWNCVQLPYLVEIPCLKFLTIKHMKRVKCIGNEEIDGEGSNNRHLRIFQALISLSISWMENLIEWSSIDRPLDGEKVALFPCLETLSIQSCAKLTSFPMNDLSSLLKLEIKDCDELRFLFHEQSFPALTSLSIEGCPKLTYLRNWLLYDRGFSRLKVSRCQWLKFVSEDLGLQSSLISLEINCCNGLTFFPDEILCKLARLRRLSIGAFSQELDDFCYLNRIKDLPQLEELEIWGSDFLGRKMSHLPYQLQYLSSLDSLRIMGFTIMEALPEWLSDLQTLRYLSLNYCWKLEYQSTKTIIQRLSNLRDLYNYGCQTLDQNRSQWNEFSHINRIRIHFPESAE